MAKKQNDDVKVHHTQGCAASGCGRTDAHTHTQADWRKTVDKVGAQMEREGRKGGW